MKTSFLLSLAAALFVACGANPPDAVIDPDVPGGGDGGASGAGAAGSSGAGQAGAGASGGAGQGGQGGAGAGGAGQGGAGQGGAGQGGAGQGGAGASGAGQGGSAGASGASGQGGAGASGASGQAGAGGAACDVKAAAGVAVAEVDVFGWPPYAVDGCQLLYVSPVSGAPATSGELRLRDLATGADALVAPVGEAPRRPSIKAGVLVWEATIGGTPSVRVAASGGAPVTLTGGFDHAGEGRAGPGVVVFTGWLTAVDKADTDVFLYDVGTGTVVTIATGPAQQRWPDVSATHVAWSDFEEDADKVLSVDENDVCDVVLYDRATQQATKHVAEGKQGYPQLGSDGNVVYLHWPSVHPEPKNQAYGIRAWPFAKPGAVDVSIADVQHFQPSVAASEYSRPSTAGGVVTWIGTPMLGGPDALFRSPIDAAAATVVPGAPQGSLFTPVLAGKSIVLASSAAPKLVVVE